MMKLSREANMLIERMEKFGAGKARFKRDASKRMAEIFCEELVGVIREQRYQKTVVLSDGWIAQKARRGLDPRILIASEEYVKSIKVEPVNEHVFGVMANYELAKLHEYGTDTMPARPHWDQVRQATRKRIAEVVSKKTLYEFFGKG